jgi:hypothetical protein
MNNLRLAQKQKDKRNLRRIGKSRASYTFTIVMKRRMKSETGYSLSKRRSCGRSPKLPS